MNINTSPDAISRSTVNITPGYMSGFGNSFETEALPGALPIGRNSPQRCAYGLYAEQLSGSPFTAPRGSNERSWLYRIRPSVTAFRPLRKSRCRAVAHRAVPRIRFADRAIALGSGADPQRGHDVPAGRADHDHGGRRQHAGRHGRACLPHHQIDGRSAFLQCRRRDDVRGAAGQLALRHRVRPHRYRARRDRGDSARREIPRRDSQAAPARGYICENYGGAFTLPERGPIGANCLANARDFLTPVAAYEDKDTPTELFVKWGGALFKTTLPHSPIDVVAWHGNYAPYKYDLRTFSPIGAIGFDHPDPSIFTVLTSPSETAGHRQHRLRDLPGALGGGGKHLPAALVSHEHHVGVHGADLRRLRRQAARLYARAASACTT